MAAPSTDASRVRRPAANANGDKYCVRNSPSIIIMRVELTLEDMTVLIRTALIAYGPPFHNVPKPKLTSAEKRTMDQCGDRLRARRRRLESHTTENGCGRLPLEAGPVKVYLTQAQVRFYIKWLRATTQEYSKDDYELRVLVASRKDVEQCLRKLEVALAGTP